MSTEANRFDISTERLNYDEDIYHFCDYDEFLIRFKRSRTFQNMTPIRWGSAGPGCPMIGLSQWYADGKYARGLQVFFDECLEPYIGVLEIPDHIGLKGARTVKPKRIWPKEDQTIITSRRARL